MKPLMLLLFVFFPWTVCAFIPPISQMVGDLFEGRKAQQFELLLQHSIQEEGSPFEIAERIVVNKGRIYFLFTKASEGSVAGEWEDSAYQLHPSKRWVPETPLLLQFLVARSADHFRNALVENRFVRREFWDQYRQGFDPQGDPSTWDIKSNYLKHNEIYLQRGSRGVAIAVNGEQEKEKQIHFLFEGRGISRIQWKSSQAVAWELGDYRSYKNGGLYPTSLELFLDGKSKVKTNLGQWKTLSQKGIDEFLKSWRTAKKISEFPPSFETRLGWILAYR